MKLQESKTNKIAKTGSIGHRQQLVIKAANFFDDSLLVRSLPPPSVVHRGEALFGWNQTSQQVQLWRGKNENFRRSSFGTHASLLVTPKMLVFCDRFCEICSKSWKKLYWILQYPGTFQMAAFCLASRFSPFFEAEIVLWCPLKIPKSHSQTAYVKS